MSQIAIIDQNAARAQGWIALLSEHGLSGVHLTTVDHLGDDHFSCAIAIAEQVEAKVPVLARAMPLLLIAESPSVRQAVAAMQRGAVDYFEAPVADAELIAAVERACAAQGNAPTPQKFVGAKATPEYSPHQNQKTWTSQRLRLLIPAATTNIVNRYLCVKMRPHQ